MRFFFIHIYTMPEIFQADHSVTPCTYIPFNLSFLSFFVVVVVVVFSILLMYKYTHFSLIYLQKHTRIELKTKLEPSFP